MPYYFCDITKDKIGTFVTYNCNNTKILLLCFIFLKFEYSHVNDDMFRMATNIAEYIFQQTLSGLIIHLGG